ncbi:MAG: caspase family protein, partial [Lachnospiraceae bacterium]|nr:caspase family protein [Lachnospiraceae bacterium]
TVGSSTVTITSQPADVSTSAGTTVTFTVGASGTGLTYQWQTSKDGGNTWLNSGMTGYNTKTLTVSATIDRNGYKFRCVVTDKFGTKATSKAATLTVASTLKITAQPESVTADAGTKVKFVVGASGTGLTYQWQTSKDGGSTWANSGMSGYNTNTLNVDATADRNGYKFRCVVSDKSGAKVTSNAATLTVKAAGTPKITEATVDGTNVKLTWTEVKGATYTVMYAKGNNTLTQLATKISGTTYTAKGLDPNTTYKFTVYATVNGTAGSQSPAVTVTTGSATGDVTYRALLVGEEAFSPICTRNRGDVELMKGMLANVKTGTGNQYSVVDDYYNLDSYDLMDAIEATFAGADDNDVSLFFIATHGDVSYTGSYAGYLALVDAAGNDDYILLCDLEECLSQIPGKVIVILESCGSGAAVYDPEVPENAAEKDIEFTNSVIDTFASADPGYSETKTYYFDAEGKDITAEVNTGEFRKSKYYVLTASRYQEYSWGSESYRCNFFTKWLVEGIGRDYDYEYMPADSNEDDKVTLNEAHSYVKEINDEYSFYSGGSYYYQHSQVYPENCDFVLFTKSDLGIVYQPEDVTAAVGEEAEFFVIARGTGLKYQWQTSKDGGSTWANSSLTGYNTSALSITASTDRNGYMFRCVVTNASGEKIVSDAAKLTVVSGNKRALIVSNNYTNTSSELGGCINDGRAMKGMLEGIKDPYYVTWLTEATSNEIISAIGTAYKGATADSVSFFSYSGHGVGDGYQSSYTGALVGTDFDYVTMTQLANALSQVPGKIVVFLDSCHSGASIAKDPEAAKKELEDYNKSVIEAFSGYNLDGTRSEDVANWGDLANSKFIVITAASWSNYSYDVRLSDGTRVGLFTYCFLGGLGCSYPDGAYQGEMEADTNGDNKITLYEAATFARENQTYIAEEILEDDDPCSQYYGPDDFILFTR